MHRRCTASTSTRAAPPIWCRFAWRTSESPPPLRGPCPPITRPRPADSPLSPPGRGSGRGAGSTTNEPKRLEPRERPHEEGSRCRAARAQPAAGGRVLRGAGGPVGRRRHGPGHGCAPGGRRARPSPAHARSRGNDVVLVDTAGRLQMQRNLLEELAKVGRVTTKALDGGAYESLLVLDAVLGLSSLAQARAFHKAIPMTGLVLAKLDGSAKGGAVIAIENELDVPVKLAGVGEGIEDLEPFDPDAFVRSWFED